MDISSRCRSYTPDTGAENRRMQCLRPDDIVIRLLAGMYVISTLAGERIGTSHDRFDAMCRGCAAAREAGRDVWILVEGTSEIYHEVLCP
jgi:hypothetical protein